MDLKNSARRPNNETSTTYTHQIVGMCNDLFLDKTFKAQKINKKIKQNNNTENGIISN